MSGRTNTNPGSRYYYRWRVGPWNFYISRYRLRLRNDLHGTGVIRRIRGERRRMAGNRCEACGRDVSKYVHLWRVYPAGHPERNLVENCRVLCLECNGRANASEEFRKALMKGGGDEKD